MRRRAPTDGDGTRRVGVEHLAASPVASMWASIPASTRRSRASAAATVDGEVGGRSGRPDPSTAMSRPASSTPAACERGQVEVGMVGPADELQRGLVGGREAGSAISSMVRSRLPMRSSHQKMSMPR